jgi:AmmeMemoRadiSam system protein B
MEVRPCAVAGSWYPGARAALERAVDAHLAAATAVEARCPLAIIVPHAGLMYSGPVAAHAYQVVRGCTYEAVVLVGPSHFVGFDGLSVWPRGAWDSPLGSIPVAEDLASSIASARPLVHENRSAHAREHSLEMQLPFVARLLPGVPIVPLVMGFQTRATAEQFGDALAGAVRDTSRRWMTRA